MSIVKIRPGETGEWESLKVVRGATGPQGPKGDTGATGPQGPKGNDGISAEDLVPAYVKEEADRVAALVQSRQNANTVSFIVCSDLHYSLVHNVDNQTAAMTHMGQAMGLIRKAAHIDFAAMLGDMVWDSGETLDIARDEFLFVNKCLHDGFANIPVFRTRGNHEDCYESGVDLTENQVFSNIGIFNTGAVYDPQNRVGGYCYRDFDDLKLRVICLNSSEGGGCQFSSAQVSWLGNALDLTGKGAGWRSIILSHHPLDWGKSGGESPIETINKASGVICTFHGHIHNYLVDTVTGTELQRISIPNACHSRENQYAEAYGINWKESTTYSKTPGTADDTAFCVVTIDLAEKKIYADHYGAGYDRVIAYDDAVVAEYSVTNTLSNVKTNNAATSITEGASYTATLTANAGYNIGNVTVTMGGVDITATSYSAGKINISNVSGNIVITATADEIPSGDYTNLVSTATTVNNGSEIYNGIGYKDGAYVSSNATYGSDANCVATGYIPYTPGDVVYIKGAELTKTSHVRCYIEESGGSALFYCESPDVSAGVWSPTGSAQVWSIETLGEQYYKLTPTEAIANHSKKLTYRLSLYGTGNNLIVTHNEPIE